tara:strand:- start:428 stop:565 length:138 start_codon:yes stop_codon:yes gene_type:complete
MPTPCARLILVGNNNNNAREKKEMGLSGWLGLMLIVMFLLGDFDH